MDWSNKKWWITSWKHIITNVDLCFFEELPNMKIMRNVSPKLIYHLLSNDLYYLEVKDAKSMFSLISDWANDLVIGYSNELPPWIHKTVAEEKIELIKDEFKICSISLEGTDGCDWVHQIVKAEKFGICWKDWCFLILDKYITVKEKIMTVKEPTIQMILLKTIILDLVDAIKDDLESIVFKSLKRLGWPCPWVPGV